MPTNPSEPSSPGHGTDGLPLPGAPESQPASSVPSPTDPTDPTGATTPHVYTGGRSSFRQRRHARKGTSHRDPQSSTSTERPQHHRLLPAEQRDQAHGAAPASPGAKRSVHLILVGVLACSMALLVGGFMAGWTVKDSIQAGRTSTQPDVVEVPVLDASAGTHVPDVRGLTLVDAKQALADLDLDPSAVTTTEIEWAGAPGLVIAQDPVVGEVFSGTLTLTLSKQASVPDVIGKSRADAVDALRALGTEPAVVEEFDARAPAGSVLRVDPGVGSALPNEVTLTVAEAGSSLYLSVLAEASTSSENATSCYSGEVSLNGTAYTDALACSTRSEGEEAVASWVLGRHADLFTATAGVSDSDDPEATGVVRVLADGAEVARVSVSYGSPVEIKADVSGALRLDLIVSSPTGSDIHLGEALLRGTDSQIDALEAAS